MSPAASGFDRVRPRTPRVVPEVSATGHDAQGKRALFSSTSSNARPTTGSVVVECSRCDERTVLGPIRALRTAWPSLHLAVRVGHGEEISQVGVSKRDFPSYLRCPACGRPSWVRYTIQL